MVAEEDQITRTYPCSRCKTVDVRVTAEASAFEGRFGDTYARAAACCEACGKKERQEEAEEELRQKWMDFEMRRRISGLPQAMWERSFKSLTVDAHNGEAIEQAKKWSRGEFKGLLLAGPVGTGKSTTAAAALLGYLFHQRQAKWAAFSSVAMATRAGFRSEKRDQVFELLLNPNMPLVLDDIDKTQPTDYTVDLLYQAIDERYSHNTPLLVTTNLDKEALADQYGEPIASRLGGYCRAVIMGGSDRR